MAHAQKLVAGRDWAFTFGPLGYLSYPEPEGGGFGPGLIYRAALHLGWIAAVAAVALRSPTDAMGCWVAVVFATVAVIDDFMISTASN